MTVARKLTDSKISLVYIRYCVTTFPVTIHSPSTNMLRIFIDLNASSLFSLVAENVERYNVKHIKLPPVYYSNYGSG